MHSYEVEYCVTHGARGDGNRFNAIVTIEVVASSVDMALDRGMSRLLALCGGALEYVCNGVRKVSA